MAYADIYIHAICDRNTKKGAYLARVQGKDLYEDLFNAVEDTNNHRLELMAMIEAITSIKGECDITIHSSDEYLIQAMGKEGRIEKWRKKQYRVYDKEIGEMVNRPNRDLLEVLYLVAKDKGMFEPQWRAQAWRHISSKSSTMYKPKTELVKRYKAHREANLTDHERTVKTMLAKRSSKPMIAPMPPKEEKKKTKLQELRAEMHAIRNR